MGRLVFRRFGIGGLFRGFCGLQFRSTRLRGGAFFLFGFHGIARFRFRLLFRKFRGLPKSGRCDLRRAGIAHLDFFIRLDRAVEILLRLLDFPDEKERLRLQFKALSSLRVHDLREALDVVLLRLAALLELPENHAVVGLERLRGFRELRLQRREFRAGFRSLALLLQQLRLPEKRDGLRIERVVRGFREIVLFVERIFLPDARDVFREVVVPLRIEKTGQKPVKVRRRERRRAALSPVRILHFYRLRHCAEGLVHHAERAPRVAVREEGCERDIELRLHERRLAVILCELFESGLHLRGIRLLGLAPHIFHGHEPLERLGDPLAGGVVLQHPLHRGSDAVHPALPGLLLRLILSEERRQLREFLQPAVGDLDQRSVAALSLQLVRGFVLHVVEQLLRAGLHIFNRGLSAGRAFFAVESAGEKKLRHIAVGKVHILVLRIFRHEVLHELQRGRVILLLVVHVEHLEIRTGRRVAVGILLVHFFPRFHRLVALVHRRERRAEKILRHRHIRLRRVALPAGRRESREERLQFRHGFRRIASAEDLAGSEPRLLRLRTVREFVAKRLEGHERRIRHRHILRLPRLRLLHAAFHEQRLHLDLRLRIAREQLGAEVERLLVVVLFQRGRREDLHRLRREAPILVVLLSLRHDLLRLVGVTFFHEQIRHQQREVVAARVAFETRAKFLIRLQCLRDILLLGICEAQERRAGRPRVLVLCKKFLLGEQMAHQRARLVRLVQEEENPRDREPRREILILPALILLALLILVIDQTLEAVLHRQIIHRPLWQKGDLLLERGDFRALCHNDLLHTAHRAERLQRSPEQFRLLRLLLFVLRIRHHVLAARELHLADEKHRLIHQRHVAAFLVRLRQGRLGIVKKPHRLFHILGGRILRTLRLQEHIRLDEKRLPDPHQRFPCVRARPDARHDCKALHRLVVAVRLQQERRPQKLRAIHVAAFWKRRDERIVFLDPLGENFLLRVLLRRGISGHLGGLQRERFCHKELRHLARRHVYFRIHDQLPQMLDRIVVKPLLHARHGEAEFRIERPRREHLIFDEKCVEGIRRLLELPGVEKPFRRIVFQRVGRRHRLRARRGGLRQRDGRGGAGDHQRGRGEDEPSGSRNILSFHISG